MSMMEITMGQLLDMQAERYPDHEAVVYPFEKVRWTYSEFREKVNQIARGLIRIGIKKGQHVAVWATNVPEWLLAQFALAKVGAVLVTVNTNYKIFELEYLLRQSDSTTLIMTKGFKDSDYVKIINDLCPELKDCQPGKLNSAKLPYLKNVIYIGEESYPGMYNFNDLYRFADDVPVEMLKQVEESLSPHDVVNMQYTSGTTGFPKGVMLTHYNIINNGSAVADCMKLTYKDRLCIPVPFFHCFGCVLGVMACVTKGATMVPLDHFNPIKVMEAVQVEKCTALHGVPTMFISILENSRFKEFDFSSLRTGIMAGAPCPINVMRRVIDEMNMKEITIAYGLTEASPVITQTRVDDPIELRVSTVGRPLPGVEVRIVDPETGKDVPPGVPGELLARGYGIMKGYYKMEEATAAAIDSEGWLHTGDLAVMDENGYCKITGRIKDMIIRGGENIYPREIEEFLYTHPAVKDVQVVGVPDEKYGEEVMAYIILKDNLERYPTEEEIIEYVRNGLSRFKCPKYVRFVDGFPMTANGKVQKYKLREMAIEELKLHDVARIETA
ncbi:fatty-acyl-CoA synthase [Caldicoprobacter guelmensis]|uniref:AMP-binding protein n=1 Tax=Caldicoprobacter guelmensis TaxID=1170224 RepID=UPI001956D559|nr:AMP-binding protein [Caldicoprobacter guelmensis]MBM7581648.1 fatty-acyl-CoA synthase [Caldicoprobacter guelmensis]